MGQRGLVAPKRAVKVGDDYPGDLQASFDRALPIGDTAPSAEWNLQM